jgi:hypothetical protein
MESISEPKYLWPLHFLVPPLVFLGQYCVAIAMLLMLIFLDCPLEVFILIGIAILMAIFMIPFWYKTFFDRIFIGASPLLFIEWSDDEIHFRGAYFDIIIPPGNIIKYKVTGLYMWDPYMVAIKIKTSAGKHRTIRLSPTMRNKPFLINFLEEHNIHKVSGFFSPAR